MICQLKSLLSNNYVEEEKLGNWSFKEEKKRKILISYLLENDFSWCNVIIKGKHVNLGIGEGMAVPSEFLTTGYKLHFEILKKKLLNLEENKMRWQI